MNKRGMDAVIATVLLIAITIALIAAVYVFVVPWLQGLMGETKSCFEARIDVKSACYNDSVAQPFVNLKLGRGGETFDLGKVIVVLSNSSTSSTVTKEISLEKYEEELFTVTYSGVSKPTTVKVIPVLKDGTECGDMPVQATVTACS